MAKTDFDFLMGRWDIRNERLKERLRGSREWLEFAARGEASQLPRGFGNMDQFLADESWRPGFMGMTVRLYDQASDLWSIYWTDTTHNAFGPPVVGRFTDGVGIFEGDDHHEGTPVRVRFRWSHETPSTARWEQAFSADGGETWETNWIMSFTRAD